METTSPPEIATGHDTIYENIAVVSGAPYAIHQAIGESNNGWTWEKKKDKERPKET